ncbi:hydrolase|uniref:YqbQ/XkdQ domain-containing protein n=1 Tax=Dendrosporobacter quercicolus TaxID=146817 RepID=A0A1G9YSM5_9FIRM|nr:hypothetical protein [Dendrosporobacter quercicolus]NSL49875.1 hydrolase [Dendrosporobacter quercicolus DSM 1736]SDN12199.1 hypothetical protein SAMN04488502_11257 [Dendrosporobacter quercicolus]
MPTVQLMIQNRSTDKIYQPVVCDGVQLEWERKGVPGRLSFKAVNDAMLDFAEGDPVKMSIDNKNMFAGYVFTKIRNKDQIITVTAYDQLRYLKNKEIKNYSNLRADEVIRSIAADFGLEPGEIENTGYTIPRRRDNNQTLFDIILTALDLTRKATGEVYVLYDDFGRLMLQNARNMRVDILIDAETAEDFTYTSSIDRDTYNKIKLYFDNEETQKREPYIILNSQSIARWGLLQYCESIDDKQVANAVTLVQQLLKTYNQATRSLTIKNALGDTRVRGGSAIGVSLDLGDVVLNQHYMLVDKVTHNFQDNEHTMDLEIRGGVINA